MGIPIIGPLLTAIGEGLKLAVSIFVARNTPAMQAAAKAATIARIRASVNKHLADNDLAAVQKDSS